MAIEIERKFRIDSELWKKVNPVEILHIKQAYIVADSRVTLRIRTSNEKAYITLKGKAHNISRQEFEYEIPMDDAIDLLKMAQSNTIEKLRHIVFYNGKKWEVDEFLGTNAGLFVAEIELLSEDEPFEKPDWVAVEVTSDMRYRNTYLAQVPFSTWE